MTTTQKTEYIRTEVLDAINNVFDHGAKKHGTFSWRDGKSTSSSSHRTLVAEYHVFKALKHINAWFLDSEHDAHSEEHHLAHAASRLVIALDLILPKEENGPKRTQGEAEGVSQTSTVSDYIQKEVAAWKKATGRD